MILRPFETADWPELWPIIQAVCAAGETYAYAHDMSESDAYKTWIETPQETWVAVNEANEVVGTYYIKPNHPGPGSHVCNCGYMVAKKAWGQGLATRLCENSQQRAQELGFRAMQFNFVVSTNERAVRLWQHLGFQIAGTLPGAYNHLRLGFVDAYVMFKTLVVS